MELSTVLMLALTVLALLVASGCSYVAVRASIYADECRLFCEQRAELSELAKLSSEMTELTDAYDSLLHSHRKLRSRVGMREVRAKRKNGADEPSESPVPGSDDEKAALKRKLRDDARARGILR